MGATQRLAELAVVAGASAAFRPIVVRFGDVLGSHGSVLELMLDQIRGGLPIQVADLEASRFFMTSDEAAALVLKADLLGETGETYWLDLGGPVKIVDLAMRALVLAAGRASRRYRSRLSDCAQGRSRPSASTKRVWRYAQLRTRASGRPVNPRSTGC